MTSFKIENSSDLNSIIENNDTADYTLVSFSEITFDDVKHLLYGKVKCIAFDLKGCNEEDSLYKLYTYSKERFPDKVFEYNDDFESEIANIVKRDTIKIINDISFSEFKKDSNGLVPCIAQDAFTGEVLMMAYMNEESYNKTLETGLMTYWSRSRQKLWTKGEESGHFQRMLSLTIDCDKDTILAKVDQTGPACHTGNKTCFFTPLAENEGKRAANPLTVFDDVYNVIADRKVNPREGSYTNYLFDKGIDKILKKVGEECTEIVIAAKNPDPKEIKYEMADFLYHAMVLMVEKGVTWEEIREELANRE